MKISIIIFTLLLSGLITRCHADPMNENLPLMPKGERVPYSCNLTQFKAIPSASTTSPLDDKRIPGAGRLLREYTAIRTAEHIYEISGIVLDDNVGVPKENASVFIGNIETDNTLTLVARTDKQGHFFFRINNKTAAQMRQWAESRGFTVGNISAVGSSQEVIFNNRKYLYVGESDVDLYRYEIPYQKAEQAVAGYPPQGVGSPEP